MVILSRCFGYTPYLPPIHTYAKFISQNNACLWHKAYHVYGRSADILTLDGSNLARITRRIRKIVKSHLSYLPNVLCVFAIILLVSQTMSRLPGFWREEKNHGFTRRKKMCTSGPLINDPVVYFAPKKKSRAEATKVSNNNIIYAHRCLISCTFDFNFRIITLVFLLATVSNSLSARRHATYYIVSYHL